jgi:hypothetical protein
LARPGINQRIDSKTLFPVSSQFGRYESWKKALETGDAYPILQIAAKKIPELSNVPLALDVAKTDEARQLLKAGAIDPGAIVRVYVTTPRTPKDRLLNASHGFRRDPNRPGFCGRDKKNKSRH